MRQHRAAEVKTAKYTIQSAGHEATRNPRFAEMSLRLGGGDNRGPPRLHGEAHARAHRT